MAVGVIRSRFAPARAAFRAGDAWGGLAAAAVLLPQAMAFGVALYALAGLDAASGAYAGLAGTAILCITGGLFGGTRGLISAPTGPTLVMLGAALGGMMSHGLRGEHLLLGLALTTVLAGAFQVLAGSLGGGKLIKYIPFPVVSGFMTGSAILMFLSQRGPLSGGAPGADWQGWIWLPALTALATIVAAATAGRLLPRIPGPIAGLLAGTLVFHAVAAFNGTALPQEWMIGAVPGIEGARFAITGQAIGGLPFGIILPAAAALAVLASLDTLLSAVVADVATGTRHDSRLELMGQGTGLAVSGLLGGMAGAGTTGATVVAIKSGGGRWVGVVAGVIFVSLLVIGGDIGRILPIGALAGVIIYVATGLIDHDILAWAKLGRTRQDAGIAVLVTLITVFYNLMIAVAIGVAIAATLFIREQIRAPVVHRRSTAAQMRSIRKRPKAERELLDANGDRIIVYELRGNLFFGTADRLIDELGADLNAPNWVIFHLRKVTQVDLTALTLLRQIAERLHAHGGTLLVCEVHHGAGVGSDFATALRTVGENEMRATVLTFNGRDEALEMAEDALLESLGAPATQLSARVEPDQNGIAAYMGRDQVEGLSALLRASELGRGDRLFSAGDEGSELFLVICGEIEIRISTTTHHYKRLARYGPGTFFGELALLRGGARSADAIALSACELRVFSKAAFETLKRDHPDTAIALLSAVCDSLVVNQRWSTREIQRLSEW